MTRIYNIPAGYSFLESFAKGLLNVGKKDPFALSRMKVFLPTRRACIEMQRAMLRGAEGRCFLLPTFTPLGDLDEDFLDTSFPLLSPFKRLGLLTTLIEEYTKKSGVPSSPALSLKLAKSLVSLMDQAAIEEVSWEGLAQLVPAEFAGHWQLTLDFLEIITTHWPQILEEKGVMEPHERHRQKVAAILAQWETSPPDHPILAAGSTGTMPATRRLLQGIAQLPQGSVILPGLDGALSDTEVDALSPCQPQYAPTQFLREMNLSPSDIRPWEGLEGQKPEHPERGHLYKATLKSSFSKTVPPALEGIHQIRCESPQEEALAIAILMRQQLEIPHQRIALVTSDLKLAERVEQELKRWDIEIDSSAGKPLSQTPPGVFMNLCVTFAAHPENQVALLSLLKHPLFRLVRRFDVRRFEREVLRGSCERKATSPSPKGQVREFLNVLETLIQKADKTSFEDLLALHISVAESLSTDEEGTCQLWKGPQGDTLHNFVENLKQAAPDLPPLTLVDYAAIFKEFMVGQTLRFRPERHPRLAILGTIEARLCHADVMILGGLNEGIWPPDMGMDPWLNRPMRKEMGFPSPERRIGLSAHDFGQALSCPKVYLTRALKVDGTPTIACRWLERLEVYLKSWGLSLPQESRVLEWVRRLDRPDAFLTPQPPLPCPPVLTRPRRLSVTQVETWMRDPYALYARHILSLSPLDPLNLQIGPADRGTLIHKAFEQFFKLCPDPHHPDSLKILLFIGKTLFEPFEENPSVRLFWWPRFCRIAEWFIAHERETRPLGTQTFMEVKGSLTFTTPQGLFECTAKADRIDLLPDGRLRILDYKTGMPPSEQDVTLGFSPQLPLEGAIAMAQGFEGITSTHIESLQFWWLKGDSRGGIVKTLSGDPHERSAKALAGLERMVLLFENGATAYAARPLPSKALKYNDYAHLARLQEWGKA
jgi:ATP-dependent helicase/nuclease subunit B